MCVCKFNLNLYTHSVLHIYTYVYMCEIDLPQKNLLLGSFYHLDSHTNCDEWTVSYSKDFKPK